MISLPYKNPDTVTRLEQLLSRRILLMDGAMGTMIQNAGLDDNDFHGERFADHSQALKGNNDILSLTKPDLIASIHRAFLESGADFLETNTFNATSISQQDYGTQLLAAEINRESAGIARRIS